jgi:hypothetical protein
MKVPYDKLPFPPAIVAATVAEQPLHGFSQLEDKRQRMTHDQVREFGEICDVRCRASYEAGGIMADIAAMPGNRGRNELVYWIEHLLTCYLRDPESMRCWRATPRPPK